MLVPHRWARSLGNRLVAAVTIGFQRGWQNHAIRELTQERLEVFRIPGLEIECLRPARSSAVVLHPLDDPASESTWTERNLGIAAHEDDLGTWDLIQAVFMAVRCVGVAVSAELSLPFGLPLKAGRTVRTGELAALERIPSRCLWLQVLRDCHLSVRRGNWCGHTSWFLGQADARNVW